MCGYNITEPLRTVVFVVCRSVVEVSQELAWKQDDCQWCMEGRSIATRTHIEVPVIAAGLPIMILSETPAIASVLPYAEASNR